jgi:hypothetical protein
MKNHIVKFILLIAITLASCTSFAANHSKVVGYWGYKNSHFGNIVVFMDDGLFAMAAGDTTGNIEGDAMGYYSIKGNTINLTFTYKTGIYKQYFHKDTYMTIYKVNKNKLHLINPHTGVGTKYSKLKY